MTSLLAYNGSAVVAMAGKKCVAIASDHVFGKQGDVVATDFPKVFRMGPRLFLGVTGLITDIQTVVDNMTATVSMYELKRNRKITPSTLCGILSNMLYQRRFGPYYVQSVVAGLEPKTHLPFLASLDLLGSQVVRDDFVVNGSCKMQLFGMCETLYQPNMDVDSLFEAVSQVLLNSCDRDPFSGWGATVYLLEPDTLTVRTLKARMD